MPDPSPSPEEVPEAMLEAGWKALAAIEMAQAGDDAMGRGSRGLVGRHQSTYNENQRARARAVLTAALRLDDPERLERVGRALWSYGTDRDWGRGPHTIRPSEMAEVAIASLLNTTDDEKAGKRG